MAIRPVNAPQLAEWLRREMDNAEIRVCSDVGRYVFDRMVFRVERAIYSAADFQVYQAAQEVVSTGSRCPAGAGTVRL